MILRPQNGLDILRVLLHPGDKAFRTDASTSHLSTAQRQRQRKRTLVEGKEDGRKLNKYTE
jgi:hypothetical protein